MIPAPFEYRRAGSVDEAVRLLAEHGDDARLLAGGHSLLPALRLRQVAPAVLVDVGRLSELAYVRDRGDHLAVGALIRHCDLERSAAVAAQAPLVGHAAGLVGDPQVRNRGTLGGSLAHADPAADLAVAVVALGATLVARGPAGDREIAAADFFVDRHRSALAGDEMLTEVRLPKAAGVPWAYQRVSRRAQDWATVAVAAVGAMSGSEQVTVALAGMGPVPLRASAVEQALAAGEPVAGAAAAADEGTAPRSDVLAGAGYRRHLARVLVRRTLESLAEPPNLGSTAT
ncbi:MAG TPA: FAD binding domain-containing protein [Acidimicrobiales bacterium]|nr:FAD binding domain-containing protein [Acidimicrobiales bacterium]